MNWVIQIDGASRGNPGPSGAGVYIIFNEKKSASKSAYLKKKTNNQAEYLALTLALYHARHEIQKDGTPEQILFISDSELLIRQMLGVYKIRNPEIQLMHNIISKFILELKELGVKCKFKHVMREDNVKADSLANHAIDKKTHIPVALKTLLEEHHIKI